jgi:hypothetical protein
MIGNRPIFNRGLTALFCVISLSFSCSFNTGYENVRLVRDKKSVFFYPDRNASREPMTLNIRTSFAAMKGKWGVLFSVPYRETGFGAINRTIFTTVHYATVLDHDLNQLVKKPLVLYKEEGNNRRDFFKAGDGFGVAYIRKEGDLECRVFGGQGPLKTINKYRVPAGSKVVASDRSLTNLALSYYDEKIFLLVYDRDLRIIRAGAGGGAGDLVTGKDVPDSSFVKSGDIFADRRGIHTLWVEAPRSGVTAGGPLFFHGFKSHESSSFVIRKLPVRGDNSNELKAKFVKSGSRLFMLFQYGNLVWKGEVSGRGDLLPVRKFITLGKRSYPPPTLFACVSGNCYVFFHKRDGAYIYSKNGGLKKSPFIQYRRAVECGEKKCIQETSNMGISVFDPE